MPHSSETCIISGVVKELVCYKWTHFGWWPSSLSACALFQWCACPHFDDYAQEFSCVFHMSVLKKWVRGALWDLKPWETRWSVYTLSLWLKALAWTHKKYKVGVKGWHRHVNGIIQKKQSDTNGQSLITLNYVECVVVAYKFSVNSWWHKFIGVDLSSYNFSINTFLWKVWWSVQNKGFPLCFQ